ncbi:MAG: RNA polymerase sigma factor [Actinomycetota bacterium]|nr:RNA polymerase sigma factor [Actinomycetota bacterium]
MGGPVYEPDPQLVRAARDGDLAAFEELVRGSQADVWRLCFHLLGDRSLAEDVAQDAFVRAYRFLSRYRGDSKFSTWLFSIVRNCCLDELRRLARRRNVAEAVRAEPTRATHESSVRMEVSDALGELSVELREPVVLIDMFGESYKQAARILGVPEGTVKSRVHRARALLARSLGVEVADES